MTGESKVGAVREYLCEQFGSGQVSVDSKPAGMVFRVVAGSSRFALTVVRDFLEAHDVDGIKELLTRWNLAEELRRADGLPMVMSEEGVRLASSN